MKNGIISNMYDLKKKKLFLLDMDGTIYLDDYLFPGTKELLNSIKDKGGKYVFLTNNSSKGVESYIEKMDELGIRTVKDDFLTSVDCLIEKLKGEKGLIYIMGTESFIGQMKDNGFNVVSEKDLVREPELEKEVKLIVLGFDRELTFNKINQVCRMLSLDKKSEIKYLATNPDWVCPVSYGFVPDCGSFAKMIENATGRTPEFIGKPNPDMVFMAMDKFNMSTDETVVIGDRIYTDIASGVNAKCDTIFVLSGEGTESDILKYNIKPTYILKSIEEIKL